MGYTTDFSGEFTLDRPLTPEHKAYLTKFNETRRMRRDPQIAATLPDPVREAVGLPVGPEGDYFVGGPGFMGQNDDPSVVEHNSPPNSQPGLWCQWTPNEEGTAIVWDEGEKFYEYTEWLWYLIENFLKPWGYVLNGTVRWQGEDSNDCGAIKVKNNDISTRARA
jgi:hypothetical protein